jgi:VanZ family protein
VTEPNASDNIIYESVIKLTTMPQLKPLFKNRWLFLFILILSVVTISILAFAVPPKQPNMMPNDKLTHFFAFFTLAFLTSQSLLIHVRFQLALLGCYGLLIELVQSQLPYRTASIADFAADSAGALSYFAIASLCTLIAQKLKSRENQHV